MLAATLLPAAGPLDPAALLHSFGSWALLGVALTVFVESGVLFPFLPGDSLLVAAAILAPGLGFSPWTIAAVATAAAIAGDQVGYTIGRRLGRRLFRPGARVLRTSRLEDAERFFTRYGPAALVLGRFVPVVRTYVPLTAGVGALHHQRFLRWNALGGILWAGGLTLAGTLLGGLPLVRNHIDLLAVIVVLVSVLPIAASVAVRSRRARRADTTSALQRG
ncbi:DedA family protein [Xylanimonas allomyrinae]|uniref:DedA family protein n=1 Tax=Xylanimonas allomyrinae TaxID=2509459 RepID=A0A4P6ELR9_9MICO|nr:VTT domain-containing protein [Xylanimonas allomyrinae]QAY63216.1 DedA family protein [Xylanimonas allomyrinae]